LDLFWCLPVSRTDLSSSAISIGTSTCMWLDRTSVTIEQINKPERIIGKRQYTKTTGDVSRGLGCGDGQGVRRQNGTVGQQRHGGRLTPYSFFWISKMSARSLAWRFDIWPSGRHREYQQQPKQIIRLLRE
jgi:hypothetical protein